MRVFTLAFYKWLALAARTVSEGPNCQLHNKAPPIFEQRIMWAFYSPLE